MTRPCVHNNVLNSAWYRDEQDNNILICKIELIGANR